MSVAVTAIGLAAGGLTTLAFVPQVVKTWRTRQTRDISLGMFAVLVAGVALWIVYGAILGDVPLIAANGATFVLAGTILALKLREGRQRRAQDDGPASPVAGVAREAAPGPTSAVSSDAVSAPEAGGATAGAASCSSTRAAGASPRLSMPK